MSDESRRALARRLAWPAGALAECERLDAAHPGWAFCWLGENRYPGWERPAGFAAHRPGWGMIGEDQLRREPEDGFAREPWCFGPDVAELEQRIAEVEERYAAREAAQERLWESMRNGLR